MVMTVSAREFVRDLSGTKRAASQSPVFITDRGKPVHAALLAIDDYYRVAGGARESSLLELMDSLPGTAGIEYEAPRMALELNPPEAP